MLEALKKVFPDPVINEGDLERYKAARGLYIEDPWERVKTIFSLDDFGNLHPELVRSMLVGQTGFFLGAGIGAIKESVKQSREFIRTNDTNVYLSKNEMYRIMTNKGIIAMFKGGLKWGPKVGLFAGGFTLAAACCEAYRNKTGIIEYVIGGYVAGGISRSFLGIRGFIAGGIIGAILGLVYGSIRVGVERLTKTDALVVKYSQYAFSKHRKEYMLKMRNSSMPNPPDTLGTAVHGEHTPDPLNALDAEDKNPEIKEKK